MGHLIGMKALCDKVNRSESTVLSWIRELGFPAKKVGGIWESTDSRVDKWKKEQLEDEGIMEAGKKGRGRRSDRTEVSGTRLRG
jgi:hypothetical protein